MTRDESAELIERRALEALAVIENAIRCHPGTGQAGRLVRFLAGVYNGQQYPFDLSEFRMLDAPLGVACLNYLMYDRLGRREVHTLLSGGAAELHAWIAYHGIQ